MKKLVSQNIIIEISKDDILDLRVFLNRAGIYYLKTNQYGLAKRASELSIELGKVMEELPF